MIKKISTIILVLAVLIAGYISMSKLNFLERSALIFKFNSSEQSFRGRGGRGFSNFEGREGFERRPEFREGIQRPERMNIPDSIRGRFEGRGQRPVMRERNVPDSLTSGRLGNNSRFSARGPAEGRMRSEGRGRGRDFRGGSSVYLKTVLYYLAVFAFFTVIVIYLEKAFCLIFKRKSNFFRRYGS
jgi:hypothetical protein